jgi:hypothetical protein
MSQRPVAVGLLLCEQVIVEASTRNVTPVNCFHRRAVARFPSGPLPFVVFAILTDGLGQIPLELLIQRLDTLEQLYRYDFTCSFSDPLHEVRCMIRVLNCSFPVPGYYQVTLLAKKEIVGQRRFQITQTESHT